eukprot:592962-Rhodomonas_salina.1
MYRGRRRGLGCGRARGRGGRGGAVSARPDSELTPKCQYQTPKSQYQTPKRTSPVRKMRVGGWGADRAEVEGGEHAAKFRVQQQVLHGATHVTGHVTRHALN